LRPGKIRISGVGLQTLSVIIPNTDSLLIGKILQAFRRQTTDLSAVEILVVGTDEPGLVVEDELVWFIPTGPSACASDKRNIGMREARGDILLFLDDDCLPAPDWIERHLNRHRQGEQVVGGSVTFGLRNYLQLADNISAFHDLLPFTPEGPRPYLSTANLSVNRAVVVEAGTMEAHKNRAEDLEWTVRFRAIGYRLYFEPRAVIFHDPPRNTWSTVWRHWTGDAHDTLRVRLRYSDLLQIPRMAKYRSVFLWGAPLVAAWATARNFGHPEMLRRYWHTLPMVYLTKLAWCWGAFRDFPGKGIAGKNLPLAQDAEVV
jgi:glycosyltransferase involved in cell wall biosynthesis